MRYLNMKKAKDDINYFTLQQNKTVYAVFHVDFKDKTIKYSHINYSRLSGNNTFSLEFVQETKYIIASIINKIKNLIV